MDEKQLLINSRLKAKEIAERLGVSLGSAYNFLKEDFDIPLNMQKLIQHEFGTKKNELKEPGSNYSLSKDLRKRINDLEEIILEKQNMIDLQQKVISLLESKLNDKNEKSEKNSNSA